jgi:sulfur carrier protein
VDIRINGELREVAEGVSLATLLDELRVNRQQIAVEVNEQLVPRTCHSSFQLASGDRLEIVTLVGGG